VEPSDRVELVAASERLVAASAYMLELSYHLRRGRYSPYERGRVEAVVREWLSIDHSLTTLVDRLALGETTAHTCYRSQIGAFRESIAELVIHFEEHSRKLTAQRQAAERDAANTLPIVLKEYLRPAEVILAFARNEVEKLVKAVDSCERLSTEVTVRLNEMMRSKPLSRVDIGELRELITELKSQMRTLSCHKSWLQR
jgi:hypothetical protein